jgi:hypothetical protein
MDSRRILRGDRFVVTKRKLVSGMYAGRGPTTEGFDAYLEVGEVFVAQYDQVENAKGFGAIPQDKNAFDSRYLEKHPDARDKGYHLVILAGELGDWFEKESS